MAPRRSARNAQSAAPPAPDLAKPSTATSDALKTSSGAKTVSLQDYVFLLRGEFASVGQTQDALADLCTSLGAKVTKSLTKTTTHVICTEKTLKGKNGSADGLKTQDVPILSPDFILDAAHGKDVDPNDYNWSKLDTSKSSAGQKRPVVEDGDSDEAGDAAGEDQPSTKRAKTKSPSVNQAPLFNYTIAFSGRFDAHGKHNQASLENLARHLGAFITRSVTSATTHVVCSKQEYLAYNNVVAAARGKEVPCLSADFILESDKNNKVPDLAPYRWSTLVTSDELKSSQRPQNNDDSNNGDDDGLVNGDGDKKSQPSTKKAVSPSVNKTMAKSSLSVPVDEYCPASQQSEVYIDPTGNIWDASLNQTNASHNNNKFYKIQLIRSGGDYMTWTRWGRVGEAGQKAMLGDKTLDGAVQQFKKKFRDKSGLPWEKRGDNPKPGKYAFVERSYEADSDEDEESPAEGGTKVKEEAQDQEEDEVKDAQSTLSKPLQELIALIFNQAYFQATMADLQYDANKLPLGKLSKTTITRGFQQLKDLAELMDDPTLASTKWNTSVGAATENLSNGYYSIIPHAFGRNRPPVIHSVQILKKEIELLESLSDMKAAIDLMKIDKKVKSEVHPLDRNFQSLGMEEMTVLDKQSNEFSMLQDYLHKTKGDTHYMKYKVEDIFRIERQGEKQRFDTSPYAKMASDRRLLWHGSRCTNFGGILSQGLRIAPPEAPVTGYMFGKGIYLADMSSKSANYCCWQLSQGQALLLLCEAELGDPMQKLTQGNYNAGEDAKQQGLITTLGQGSTGPDKWVDGGVVHESLKGVKLPDCQVKPGDTKIPNSHLLYNEYICYDVAQIKLRYLFRINMHG